MPASTGWRRSRPRKARNDPDANGLRQGGSGRSPRNVRSKLLLRRLQYSPAVAPSGRVTRLADQCLQLLYLVAFAKALGSVFGYVMQSGLPAALVEWRSASEIRHR